MNYQSESLEENDLSIAYSTLVARGREENVARVMTFSDVLSGI